MKFRQQHRSICIHPFETMDPELIQKFCFANEKETLFLLTVEFLPNNKIVYSFFFHITVGFYLARTNNILRVSVYFLYICTCVMSVCENMNVYGVCVFVSLSTYN